MGLFSRKKSQQASPASTRRPSASEAEAAELRGRARRRLIGALVLVLTAIIVVPLMFDDTSTPQTDTPLVLPAAVPPAPEPEQVAVIPPEHTVDTPVMTEGQLPESSTTNLEADDDAAMAGDPEVSEAPPAPIASPADGSATPEPEPESAPRSEPTPAEPASAAAKPEQTRAEPEDERTDDGSVALALLEGRTPPTTPQRSAPDTNQGSFVLQVAAYSTEADAQKRRTSLVNAGVTNAYVERAVSNDKTTYRLRVGSFPSRDAAQAAQARLRALGYDNSLLLTQ